MGIYHKTKVKLKMHVCKVREREESGKQEAGRREQGRRWYRVYLMRLD